jgi:hypothetical protein
MAEGRIGWQWVECGSAVMRISQIGTAVMKIIKISTS